MIGRGEVWWASLGKPKGSGPGFRRPVVVVQSNDFNRSAIRTVVTVVITSNLRLAQAPGNVRLTRRGTGLGKESVVNVSQIVTIDRTFFTEKVGRLTTQQLQEVDDGVRLVLSL